MDGNSGLKVLTSQSLAKIAKGFSFKSVVFEVIQEGPQGWQNLLPGYEIFQFKIKAMAKKMAADVDGVFVAAAAYQADVALVGASAPIGTASHANAEPFIG
jgi:hypothetical protein